MFGLESRRDGIYVEVGIGQRVSPVGATFVKFLLPNAVKNP